jgi:succinoglycan biosynthesis transport protein ExoP
MYGLLAVVWGGALGVGLIFVLEFFDKGIKSAAEVQKYLALPCLGVAPELGRSVDLQRLDGVPFEFTEAIRSISATLLNSASRMPRSVLVTSANAREGKTLVAGHLALTLAQVGQRVLLVDADLRRSRVHELLASNRGPGLSDLLRGSARLGSVMRKPVSGEFWFIPAGSPRADSANLLGTERLGQLIDQLTSAFDWVIVDSPPVLAVADTGFITKAVSAVLLVVGANSATRDAVQAAIDRLESLNAKPFGVVLNRTTRGEQTDYSHGQYRPEHESQYSTTPSASARA